MFPRLILKYEFDVNMIKSKMVNMAENFIEFLMNQYISMIKFFFMHFYVLRFLKSLIMNSILELKFSNSILNTRNFEKIYICNDAPLMHIYICNDSCYIFVF